MRLRHPSKRARLFLRLAFFAVMIALFAIALRGRWHDMTESVEQLSWWVLVIATVLGFGIIVTSMMAWRTLLRDLESPLPIHSASRIFYLGQLGKYLPGSVWTVVVQAELGRDYKIPPRRTVAASVVSMGIALGAGLSIAAFTLPYASPGAAVHYWWVLFLLPLVVIGLLPSSVDFLTHLLLKVLRREPPDHEFTWRGVVRALAWQVIGWVAIGAQTYVLCLALHAPVGRTILLAVGGTALELVRGFRRGAGARRRWRAGGRFGCGAEPGVEAGPGAGRGTRVARDRDAWRWGVRWDRLCGQSRSPAQAARGVGGAAGC